MQGKSGARTSVLSQERTRRVFKLLVTNLEGAEDLSAVVVAEVYIYITQNNLEQFLKLCIVLRKAAQMRYLSKGTCGYYKYLGIH